VFVAKTSNSISTFFTRTWRGSVNVSTTNIIGASSTPRRNGAREIIFLVLLRPVGSGTTALRVICLPLVKLAHVKIGETHNTVTPHASARTILQYVRLLKTRQKPTRSLSASVSAITASYSRYVTIRTLGVRACVRF